MSNRLLFGKPGQLLSVHALPAPTLSIWKRVRAAWLRHRSSQRIAELDGHLLKDIGVTFAEAEAEANKPVWRA